jgi:ketosteroid isomerase-like protein
MGLRRDIQDLHSEYVWANDRGDVDAILDCFVPDGVFWTNSGADAVVGRPALREFFARAQAYRAGLGQQPRHLVGNLLVERADGRVVARAYMTLVVTEADGTAGIACTGWYRDSIVRSDGRWRFAERRLTFDSVPGTVR